MKTHNYRASAKVKAINGFVTNVAATGIFAAAAAYYAYVLASLLQLNLAQ